MGVYKNEVDKPGMPSMAHKNAKDMSGMEDFYGQCDPIAYGQAGEQGCKSDDRKISSQFKDYHWTT